MLVSFEDPAFKVYLTLTRWDADRSFRSQVSAAMKKAKVDRVAQEIHPDVERFLIEFPLDDSFCAAVRTLGWPSFKALGAIVPGWDGEESPISEPRFGDIVKLPSLEELTWPGNWLVPATAIPDHPTLRRVTVPTDYEAPTGLLRNDGVIDALVARGFRVVSSAAYGQTVLERS